MTLMGMAVLGAMWIDRHPAHRVLHASLRMPALRMLMPGVIGLIVVRVSFVNCHGDPTLSLYTLRG